MFDRVLQHSFVVSNIERSLSFYQDILGFELARLSELDPESMRKMTGFLEIQKVRIALLWMGPHLLELMEYTPQTKQTPATRIELGASHMAFPVEDMEAACTALAAKGVKLVGGPRPGARYFVDPDGISMELISSQVAKDQVPKFHEWVAAHPLRS